MSTPDVLVVRLLPLKGRTGTDIRVGIAEDWKQVLHDEPELRAIILEAVKRSLDEIAGIV